MKKVPEAAIEALINCGCEVKLCEAMKLHTSFKIGGNAGVFCTVSGVEPLCKALNIVKQYSLPLFLVGNGTNILVSDEGISGVVLKLTGDFCSIDNTDNKIYAGAGAQLSNVCFVAQRHSLSGMEFAYGIPGSVGGGAFMNAGAYGGELKDIIEYVDYVNLNGVSGRYYVNDCGFAYRTSVFQKSSLIITGVCFALKDGNAEDIKADMDDILGRRKTKQPLEMPSAGSVFKRPEGHFAGSLIEQCGLKGKSVGGAQVSEKHAGFIVNTGNASCADVLSLVELIQKTVQAETGVALECEIKLVS